jgi:hypothetical protein
MRPFSPAELDTVERFLHEVAAVTRWQDDLTARASAPEHRCRLPAAAMTAHPARFASQPGYAHQSAAAREDQPEPSRTMWRGSR